MANRLIYLQNGFWNKIIKDKTVQGKKLFWDIYSALELSDICADIPKELWGEEDSLLYYLLQNSADGYGTKIDRYNPDRINSALNKDIEQSIENLCAVYLLDIDDTKCVDYGNQLGILCLNANTFRCRNSYVLGTAVDYKKNERYDNFAKFCDYISPCNSLVLIDPYILKGSSRSNPKTNSIEINLIPLLDKIIPKKLEIPFHLSIFSQSYGCVIDTSNYAKEEEVYNYLEEKIQQLRPNVNILFELYHIKTTGDGNGDFHSRHILTNSMSINAEDGFDLFKNKFFKKAQKNKVICGKYARIEFIHPSLSNNRRLEADNYIQWISIVKKNINNPNDCWGWGTYQNRLFNLIK